MYQFIESGFANNAIHLLLDGVVINSTSTSASGIYSFIVRRGAGYQVIKMKESLKNIILGQIRSS